MLIAAKITRPFRQLTQAAVDMAESDFQNTQISDRLIPATSDEVGHLTNAFNQMATKLRSQVDVLQAERSMIAAVFEAMSDGVLIVDSQGRLEMINPSAEEMFSVRREDVLGHSLAEGLRHHLLVELWQKSLESGKTESALLEIRAERLSLQAVAKPLSDDHSASTLLLITNLTRQRYLETVRRDFISNLSHELRTPLASLKALTETLQTGALDDPPAARRFLQRMETEVDALSQMVAELLELSRIESGRVPLQLKPVNPVDVITSAVDRLRMQAERAHLSLHIDPPSNLPNIQADLQRLEQVMVNLLHNAIKFTPPGGDIHVSARLEPGGEGTPESIVFIVRDTGVGIAAEDLPRIFERFYKADRARASGGTGLGLAIARHTVEAHSGRLWAESVEGKGSTFYFSIPVNPQ
jgi:two-component system phosphate regulon sensor histidine kinase PhoR